jgi:hypothetical protein
MPKNAGRTGENERPDFSRQGLFEQVESSRDIGVHEVLGRVSDHVRFMQRCRVENGVHPVQARSDEVPIRDGANEMSEGRGFSIQA